MEYKIESNFFLGVDLSYSAMVIKEADVETNGKKAHIKYATNNYDNISRADLLVGLRYSF